MSTSGTLSRRLHTPDPRRPITYLRQTRRAAPASTSPGRPAARPGPRSSAALELVEQPARRRRSAPVSAASSICWAIRPAGVTPRFSAPPASLWETCLRVSASPVVAAPARIVASVVGRVGDEVADRPVEVRGVARVEVAQLVEPRRGPGPRSGAAGRGRGSAQSARVRRAASGCVRQPPREHGAAGRSGRPAWSGSRPCRPPGSAPARPRRPRRSSRSPGSGARRPRGRGSPGSRRSRPCAASARPSGPRRSCPRASASRRGDAVVGGRRPRSRATRASRWPPSG